MSEQQRRVLLNPSFQSLAPKPKPLEIWVSRAMLPLLLLGTGIDEFLHRFRFLTAMFLDRTWHLGQRKYFQGENPAPIPWGLMKSVNVLTVYSFPQFGQR